MHPRRSIVLVIAACAGTPPAEPPAEPAPAAAPAGPRTGTITATADGLVLPDRRVLPERARHLRLDRAAALLYFFDPSRPTLRALDLAGDDPARTVAELPPLEHPAFASPDPLAYLQRQEDLGLDGATLCLDLHDRPEQPTASYNLRVDLTTGVVERRLVEDLAGDRCGALREAVRPRLCTPAGPSAAATADGTRVDLSPPTAPAGTPPAPAPAAPPPGSPATP